MSPSFHPSVSLMQLAVTTVDRYGFKNAKKVLRTYCTNSS